MLTISTNARLLPRRRLRVVLLVLPGPGCATWFAVYADVKDMAGQTLVKYPDPNFFVEENQLVHVVGVVDNDLRRPT